MLPVYKQILNQFAYQSVQVTVDVPDVALGIGWAQDMSPQPLILTIDAVATTKAVIPDIRTIDQAAIDFQGGNPVNPSDFPNSGYLGEMLGGF